MWLTQDSPHIAQCASLCPRNKLDFTLAKPVPMPVDGMTRMASITQRKQHHFFLHSWRWKTVQVQVFILFMNPYLPRRCVAKKSLFMLSKRKNKQVIATKHSMLLLGEHYCRGWFGTNATNAKRIPINHYLPLVWSTAPGPSPVSQAGKNLKGLPPFGTEAAWNDSKINSRIKGVPSQQTLT